MRDYTKPTVIALNLSQTNKPSADEGIGHGKCEHRTKIDTGTHCIFDNGHYCGRGTTIGCPYSTNRTSGN